MKKYLEPLGIFLGGMLISLLLFLFLPDIGEATDQLAVNTANISSTFWNWTWVTSGSVVKLFVMGCVIMGTLLATAKSFLKVR